MSSQWIRNQWIRNLYRSWFGARQRPQRNTPYARVRLESLEDRLAPAASMVSDINQFPSPTGINPANMTRFGDELFFAGEDPVHGSELWKSDGTPDGTVLVKDIFAGTGFGSPRQFTPFNGTLYFFGNNGVTGLELWKTDGTAEGTVMVKDIWVGRRPSVNVNSNLVRVGGALFFDASDGVNGGELWTSDGTTEGTVMVKDIANGGYPGMTSLPNSFTDLNGKLIFAARDSNFDGELYVSDGTATGTTLVKNIRPGTAGSYPSNLTNINGTVFFTANDGTNGEELWKTDGTAAGTLLVKDILAGSGSSAPRYLTNVNGVVYFRANNGVNGEELWKSDGTAAGTVLVKDIRTGSANSNLRNLASFNGQLFFRATDGVSGEELWRSDGTSAGTVLVRDINPGTGNSSPQDLFDRNGTLFFRANSGSELWKSDGTAAGTQLVAVVGSGTTGQTKLTEINGTLYFRASAGGVGQELWKSDGTTAGTAVVKDVVPSSGSLLRGLTDVNGVLFFPADDGTNGEEIWKTAGTAAGTVLVKDIFVGSTASLPTGLIHFNGLLFFKANDGVNGNELWRSDGTAAGTFMVKNIAPGNANSTPDNFTVVNSTLFFRASDGVNGSELWKTDGTAAGTVMVRNIRTGSASSSPTELVNVNGTLFFSADDGTNGRELWKSDGTSAGTVLVRNINPGAAASSPIGLINVNGTLYFRADDGTRGSELWKSNGTNAGTVLVKDIRPGSSRSSSSAYLAQAIFNGTLYFVANDGTTGYEVWKSDGTAAGTVLVKDIYPGNSTASDTVPRDLIVANGQVFFVAADGLDLPGHGQELWRIDASAGAVLVKDIMPGDASSSPSDLYLYNGALVFSAVDPVHGTELWTSDGTPEGTVIFADVIPGSGDGIPDSADLTQSGSRLFFVAQDMTHGFEVWQFTNDLPVITNVPALVEIPELVAYSLQVEAYDPDVPDGAGLRYQLLNAPAGASIDASGNFTWTPSEAQGPGDYSFIIRVRDGLGQVDTPITVRVLEVNLPPTVNGVPVEGTIPELAAYAFTATGEDPDLPPNELVFSLVDAPAGASIDSAGVFTWTPSEAQGPADYSFYVRLSDGATFVDVPITLHVTEVNQAPVLTGVPAEAVIPEMVAYSFNASGFDADLPASVLTFSLVNGPAGASVDGDGVFNWTPSESQGPADYSFQVRLSDGVTFVDVPITLHVTEVNRPPVLTDVPVEAYIPESVEYTFTVTADDPDLPANTLVFDLVDAPDGAAIDAAGVFTWTPSESQGSADYSFFVRLSDGATFVERPITLHVTEVNQAPVLTGVPAEAVIPEMVAYSFTAGSFDADLPANVLAFSLVNGPDGASISSSGVFIWTPSESQGPADYSFHVRLSDGVTFVEAPITLHVTEVNRPPVLTDVPAEAVIPVFVEYTFTVTAEDPDLPANILVFDLVDAPAGAAIDAVGVFTWTPSGEQALGHYSFAVRLSDGIDSVSVPITLHVTGGTAAVVGGTLYVIGTDEADQFHVNLESGPTYRVHSSLFAGGSLALDASGVDRIVFLLGAGDDDATIAGNVATPALLNGGDGNDHLNAGGGPSILLGGRGDDILTGGNARDLIFGGLGADRLNGTAGDDILVDGTSDHDRNQDALWALLAEWKRQDRSYAERVANLRNGGGLNGAVRLNSGTVHHDDSIDVLTGSSGLDWFWANLDDPLLAIDNITGSLNGEIVN